MDSPSNTQSGGVNESPTTMYLLNLSPLPEKPSQKFSDANPTSLQSAFASPPSLFSGKPILVNRHSGDEANSDVYGQADVEPSEESGKLQPEQANDESREGKGILVLELASVEQGESKASESNTLESAQTIGFQGGSESCDAEPIVSSKKTLESDVRLNSAFDEQRCEQVSKQDYSNQSSPENAVDSIADSILSASRDSAGAGEACHQFRGTCRQLDFNRKAENWQTSQSSTSTGNQGLQYRPSDMKNVAALLEQDMRSIAQTTLNPDYSQAASRNSLIPVWRTEIYHTTVGCIEKVGHSFMLSPVSSGMELHINSIGNDLFKQSDFHQTIKLSGCSNTPDNSISAISDTYLANGQWGSERLVTATSDSTQFDKDIRTRGGSDHLTINSQQTSSHAGEHSVSTQADRFNYSNQASSTKKRTMSTNIDHTERCRRCNCKRTSCLKLYCDCFAAGIYCDDCCACQSCMNKPEYEDTVLDVRGQVIARNPLAFTSKVVLETGSPANNVVENDGKQATPVSARHKRGCSCKKSTCLKKYCECYQAKVGCSVGCRCQGCKNSFGTREALYESGARSVSLLGELENTLQLASRTHCIPSNYTVSCREELDSRKIERSDQFSPEGHTPTHVRHIRQPSHPRLYVPSNHYQHHALHQNRSSSSSVDQSHELGSVSLEGLKGGGFKFISKYVSSSSSLFPPPLTPFTDPKTGGEKKLDFDPGGSLDNQ